MMSHRTRTTTAAALFVLGLVLPAFIPVLYIMPLNAWWKGTLTAGFAVGFPELCWLVATLVVGKAGFRRIKRRTYARVRSIWRRGTMGFVCLVLASGIVTLGCSSGYVGARGGAVVIVQSGDQTGPVASSSNGIGYTYGITAGAALGSKLGIQFDPNFRTTSLTQNVNVVYQGNGLWNFNGSALTTATVIDAPVLLTSRKRHSENVSTMFGVGPHLSVVQSVKGQVSGVVTGLQGPNAGAVTSVLTSGSPGYDDDPIFGISVMAAADLDLDSTWRVRGEIRAQHDLTDTRISAYEFGRFEANYNIITSELAQTRIVMSVSILLGF